MNSIIINRYIKQTFFTIKPLQSCSLTYSMQHFLHIRTVRTSLLIALASEHFSTLQPAKCKKPRGKQSPVKAKTVTGEKFEFSHPTFCFHSEKEDKAKTPQRSFTLNSRTSDKAKSMSKSPFQTPSLFLRFKQRALKSLSTRVKNQPIKQKSP